MKKFTHMVNEEVVGKFKLGLDIHGVVDSMPDFFSFLTDSFIAVESFFILISPVKAFLLKNIGISEKTFLSIFIFLFIPRIYLLRK